MDRFVKVNRYPRTAVLRLSWLPIPKIFDNTGDFMSDEFIREWSDPSALKMTTRETGVARK